MCFLSICLGIGIKDLIDTRYRKTRTYYIAYQFSNPDSSWGVGRCFLEARTSVTREVIEEWTETITWETKAEGVVITCIKCLE